MIRHLSFAFFVAAATAALVHAEPPAALRLEKGEHIAILGNTLADRMQHDGTLEALIHKAYPQADISIRNLGFSADEVALRMRSDGVPKPEEWLTRTQADVIFAFWGFNESFGGYDGLQKFKTDLENFIKETKAAKYNGKSAPRLVLFSPIAAEKMADPNMPDPTADNTNIQNYTAAMAEVATANDVQFVDLFTPSQKLYEQAKQSLTHNGVHLTMAGYQALAPVIYRSVFGTEPPAVDGTVEKIRTAVQVENDMWLSRYRTVDQYNIYGQRSKIGYESGKGGPKVDNQAVLLPEMSVRDVMTANREKRVWALSKGSDLKVDDSNVPEVPKIGSNKPGPNPDGSYTFLGAEEAIKHMTVPKGVKVELVASEEQFPELVSPVQMAWDTKGRLWVSAWKNYPERTPFSTDGDKLLIFDIGSDGKAAKCSTFLGDLNCPTGFQFYKDGVFVMESPDLWFVRDEGTGKGKLQERVLDGLDAADSHHETNSMVIEPGGAIYLSDGVFLRTQVETAAGPVRNMNGCIYRWEPRTGKFERYVPYGFANPHGRVFDYWGNDIITDATGNENFFAPAFSGHLDGFDTHPKMQQFWARPSRPCPGTAILSSRAWPEEFRNNFLNCNVIGVQGIFRVKVTEEGSGLHGTTLENLITSDDPNFRPSGISVAPDGSLYFMDWHKPLIGHLQHHLRDPNREQAHGRIYRLTYEGMPLLKPAKIAGEPIDKLLDLLKERENNVRDRTKIELGGRPTPEVMAAVDRWVAGLDKNDPAYEHNVLEALWVKQYHNVVDEALLGRVLKSPDYHARAQGVRVLCYWRDRVSQPLSLLRTAANDAHPRVRLEAVRAASFFNGKDTRDAFLVTCDMLLHESDYYLDYCFKETTKQLQKLSKETLLPADPKAMAYFVSHMSDSELAKAPSSEPVLSARLERKGMNPMVREDALTELAKLHKTDRTTELLAALARLDENGAGSPSIADDLAKLVGMTPAKDLAAARPKLVALAETAKAAGVRRAGWAGIVVADENPAASWALAKTDGAKQSLIDGMGFVLDPALRAKFQPILTTALRDANTPNGLKTAALKALPLTGLDNAKANFAIAAAYLEKGIDRPAAAQALLQLPRTAWDKTAAGPAAQSILAYARTVPANQRTAQDFVETVQAGSELAGLLAPEEAARIRKELRGLGVNVIVVKTMREQMRYDTPQIVVEAGKPIEIIFENLDAMPHNFVVVEPGARQGVAESVQTRRPDQLDKEGRAYVPPARDRRVLAATKLVEPGQKETLKLTAPAKEGEYEYVCTFPGHWMIMWGKLVVTKDVDAYLQAKAN